MYFRKNGQKQTIASPFQLKNIEVSSMSYHFHLIYYVLQIKNHNFVLNQYLIHYVYRLYDILNGYISISNDPKIDQTTKEDKKVRLLPQGTADENYNYALDLASQLDFINAEKAFKEFLITHKESSKIADAQYWLGRVYFAQNKFEEAAIYSA